ncbi:PREDICTED: protein SGT1 homolog, partial [Thamnophis sirtalis]|uniref:Protein SGT1 homolog n=1 Tax=Thamnophis sirtalis TaxID=35019 RepID=A0A6I9Y9Y5_9SAUR
AAAAAAAASSAGLSETDIEREPAAAAQTLTAALEHRPDHAEYYRQRAYAYILLRNYHDAVADAKKALALEPNNAVAFLRQGIGEYYMRNYDSALKSFTEGETQDGADSAFPTWIKRCEEALRGPGSQEEMVRFFPNRLICRLID